jgi:ubiquinone/menaquinone biosynthesis C-methylase UbiE
MGQVRRANKRTVKFGSRSHSIRGTALELPFEDERFDSLISIASVKHWPNPERGLQECLRVLESGKPFLIVEAARESTLEDVKQFVSEFRFPGFLTPIIARGFKRFVAGQALTNREARNLFSNIDLDSFSVEKMEGLPGLKIRGIK